MDRRELLRVLLASAGAGALEKLSAAPISKSASDKLGPLLPTRPYGSTGEHLTIMGAGGYHLGGVDEALIPAFLESCLESGIRFFDNAWSYRSGKSETMMGKYFKPEWREHCFLMTKAEVKPGRPNAMQQLEESLKRMKTDYLDLWLTHAIISPADADARIPEMLEIMEKARKQGKVRHYGFSGHFKTQTHLHAIELLKSRPNTACMLPISPIDFATEESFTRKVLPELVSNKFIPLAMKAVGSGTVFDKKAKGRGVIGDRVSLEETYWFVLSLPVCTWISGMTSVEQVRENTGIAKRFTSLSEADRLAIANKVADIADVESFRPYSRWGS